MRNFLKILILLLLILSNLLVLAQESENSYLYSQEYFDYLIDCADYSRQDQLNEQKEIADKKNDNKKQDNSIDELDLSSNIEEEIVADYYEPFKLRIENNDFLKYSQSVIKEDTKTTIPITNKFSIVQNTTKFRNKYNSSDYRLSTGGEFVLNKHFNLASGLETNYRGLDQNPISRKLYLNPQFNINDKLSLTFYNKLNILDKSMDNDFGLSFSPLKSKALDLGVYAGLTTENDGSVSQSINFSTDFYFF